MPTQNFPIFVPINSFPNFLHVSLVIQLQTHSKTLTTNEKVSISIRKWSTKPQTLKAQGHFGFKNTIAFEVL